VTEAGTEHINSRDLKNIEGENSERLIPRSKLASPSAEQLAKAELEIETTVFGIQIDRNEDERNELLSISNSEEWCSIAKTCAEEHSKKQREPIFSTDRGRKTEVRSE
jgi:hypothetical protein